MAVAVALVFTSSAEAGAQQQNEERTHLGVTACSGNTCHGAVERLTGSSVAQNEYLIWSQETDKQRIDKHHKPDKVLLSDRAKQIAQNLGLLRLPQTLSTLMPTTVGHVPRRGPQFKIEDGVGCEACHGAAEKVVGTALQQSFARRARPGIRPNGLDKPMVAPTALGPSHFGNPDDDNRFGHPPYQAPATRAWVRAPTLTPRPSR
jgi:hypothetical protein